MAEWLSRSRLAWFPALRSWAIQPQAQDNDRSDWALLHTICDGSYDDELQALGIFHVRHSPDPSRFNSSGSG